MTLVAAAVVPTPPLLVPELAGGSAHLDDDLRVACDEAVQVLLAARPDRVVVVGAAPFTGPLTGSWDWCGFGVAVSALPAVARLPLAPAIGVWLLDRAGTAVARRVHGVAPDLPAIACADLGRALVAHDRVALLVCGDGSACRDVKAPGHLDPRAEGFDAAAARALATGDAASLLDLDRALAHELLASGPPAWQVLAGAAGSSSFDCALTFETARYGVAYLVATWNGAVD